MQLLPPCFISKSPLSQAYFTMDKIFPIEYKIFRKRKFDVLKPIPCFNNTYPSNINIYGMNKEYDNPKLIDNPDSSDSVLWEFFTDGSCLPNPGPGGSGYYSTDFNVESRIEPINHDTTINFCELNGIKMVVSDCLNDLNRFKQKYEYEKYINIFTDSQFVIDQLDIGWYPDYQYYYRVIDQIYELVNELNNFNVKINIIKIPSHIGIRGNTIADTLAKQAAIIAHNCKYKLDDIMYYNTYLNPINVDISKDLIYLNKWYKQHRKNEWIQRQHNWKNGKLIKHQYIGNMLHYGSFKIKIAKQIFK